MPDADLVPSIEGDHLVSDVKAASEPPAEPRIAHQAIPEQGHRPILRHVLNRGQGIGNPLHKHVVGQVGRAHRPALLAGPVVDQLDCVCQVQRFALLVALCQLHVVRLRVCFAGVDVQLFVRHTVLYDFAPGAVADVLPV